MGATKMVISEHPLPSAVTCGGNPLNSPVRRSYDIAATNSADLSATVRLYYYDAASDPGKELNGNDPLHVVLTVSDTGVGIAPENLNRITEPLFSTKARGLGLGLAIARAILDKNKGSLRVASEVGRGTTCTVRLAAAPE